MTRSLRRLLALPDSGDFTALHESDLIVAPLGGLAALIELSSGKPSFGLVTSLNSVNAPD